MGKSEHIQKLVLAKLGMQAAMSTLVMVKESLEKEEQNIKDMIDEVEDEDKPPCPVCDEGNNNADCTCNEPDDFNDWREGGDGADELANCLSNLEDAVTELQASLDVDIPQVANKGMPTPSRTGTTEEAETVDWKDIGWGD